MLGLIYQREGAIYENKQTQITAQSAVSAVKLSLKKQCRKNN